MSGLEYADALIAEILQSTKTIALVGASPKPARASHAVMKFLQGKGYRVIPVNPGQAGNEILGEMVYADLSSVPGHFEMVDIFRNSEAAGVIADQAVGLAAKSGIRTIWMQLLIRHDAAAARAQTAGLNVIMDRCPKIEIGRLFPHDNVIDPKFEPNLGAKES
ncbi:MAG: CoA-binding protein [Rhodospirillales bacterium]|nr:CoA-binding protein [Rhodospirillales bacterium]